MPHYVNLDALIKRENFEVVSTAPFTKGEEDPKVKLAELEATALFFKSLRKPDFQRRTAHWTPEKTAGLIKSFVDGDLIPALILWASESSSSIFVIDGAHRLSAFLAWVHDDYGDRELTRKSGLQIVPEQERIAQETRDLIKTTVGTYADLVYGAPNTPERAQRALRIAKDGLTLQWVRGNAESAARSFHTINTEQSPIGELEKRLIRDRKCPNAIATRALINAGTGLHLSLAFPEDNKQRIVSIASAVYRDLFTPRLEEPIKTLDLPVAGSSYSDDTVKLILDVVEFVNKPEHEEGKKKRTPRGNSKQPEILAPTMPIDPDGSATINFLQNFKRISSRIAGTGDGSLGLHPAVYFFSGTGKFQPTAFLAAVNLISDLIAEDGLNSFTFVRRDFEEMLLQYKVLINEIVDRYGSGNRGLAALARLQRYMLDGLRDRKPEEEILPGALRDDKLKFMSGIIDPDKGVKREFTCEKKSAAFLKVALENSVRCGICGARLHIKSITTDHIRDKRNGGCGTDDNAQPTHPYCNSTFKDWQREQYDESLVK